MEFSGAGCGVCILFYLVELNLVEKAQTPRKTTSAGRALSRTFLPFAYHFFLHSSLVSFIDGREHNCLHEKCCDSMATIVDEKLKSKDFKPQMSELIWRFKDLGQPTKGSSAH